MTLSTPINQITSIGKKVAPQLKKLGLQTAQDLIFYWPFRYEDWSQVKAIKDIVPGELITARGKLELIQNKRSRWQQRLVTEAIIADTTGSIRAVWFHQPYLIKNLKPGDELYLSGRVEAGDAGSQFAHPYYEKITNRQNQPTHTARIVPMYSLTRSVTQKQLRYLIAQTIKLAPAVLDWQHQDFLKKYKLVSLSQALTQVHFPDSKTSLRSAQHRLKFDELFLISLRTQLARYNWQRSKAEKIEFKEAETVSYVQSLNFTLTAAQKKSGWEILRDLQKDQPMNRLLEGDVGSGKTVVASLAILNVLLNRFQAAYLAPTEILARQQFNALKQLFKNYDFQLGLLTSSEANLADKTSSDNASKSLKTHKKRFIELINSGAIGLTVGTHALIQEKINFPLLALAVIDEQHRFGVEQRAALTRRQPQPHFLSMTATPMPRSLALTVYGDLNLSTINELPPGRLPIRTKLVPPEKRGEYYKFIQDEIASGWQAFVICPLIDPSDKLGNKAATAEYEKLKNQIFPQLKIGLVHGKLKPKDKEAEMRKFHQHEYDILVATPVIEVGIDVPNATVMVIESAERFGLASLHQFRGRVGRGKHQSHCLLFTETTSRESLQRLQALVESNDGFALAEKDLAFRGPGEVYGVRQHGFDDVLKIAKLTDYQIIQEAQAAVAALLATSPDLSKFQKIKQRLEVFESQIHLE